MTKYTEYETSSGQTYIIKIDDAGVQSSIPNDPANSDYQAYLKRDKPQVEHLTEIIPAAQATLVTESAPTAQ